mmetsp:Transcript_3578/g.6734  ORF Transcript_3578/g.6734 Transcript_3578/m.6734 type:complete len:88 (+) Transcript_3578:90-353(+)
MCLNQKHILVAFDTTIHSDGESRSAFFVWKATSNQCVRDGYTPKDIERVDHCKWGLGRPNEERLPIDLALQHCITLGVEWDKHQSIV